MQKSSSVPRLELSAKLEMTLLAGHPWVFREQLPARFDAPSGWVRVTAGKYEGVGLYDADSALAVRLYSWQGLPDETWYTRQFSRAWQHREPVRQTATTAFRWVNGEGDGIPGLVVDYYAGYAVVTCDTPVLEPELPRIARALVSAASLSGVVYRKRNADQKDRISVLIGEGPPRKVTVTEHGLSFLADLYDGQKTGLFLDHRDNRREFGRWARGKRVLNLFSYTGGFSLHAAKGGAAEVVSVDSAPGAAIDAEENFRLNGLDPAPHRFVVADVFDYLAEAARRGEKFDLIVCDPPSFGRGVKHLDKAKSAYVRVNSAGMRVLAADGLYAAASCTARIDPVEFLQTVAAAAAKTRRVFQVCFEGGQAVDHPYRAVHPEGRYLKFVMGHVWDRW